MRGRARVLSVGQGPGWAVTHALSAFRAGDEAAQVLSVRSGQRAGLDSFTVPPGESVSRVYEVPGEVVAFLARLERLPHAGIEIDFTVCGRAD